MFQIAFSTKVAMRDSNQPHMRVAHLLPRVGRIGDHEAEVEFPDCDVAAHALGTARRNTAGERGSDIQRDATI